MFHFEADPCQRTRRKIHLCEQQLKEPQEPCERTEQQCALERSLSPVVPTVLSRGEKKEKRARVLTLCPCLRDFDHIGQLLLSGRAEEMPEMFLCVSHILHCSCSYFRFTLPSSPQIRPPGPSLRTCTFPGAVTGSWTESRASCAAKPAFCSIAAANCLRIAW